MYWEKNKVNTATDEDNEPSVSMFSDEVDVGTSQATTHSGMAATSGSTTISAARMSDLTPLAS